MPRAGAWKTQNLTERNSGAIKKYRERKGRKKEGKGEGKWGGEERGEKGRGGREEEGN